MRNCNMNMVKQQMQISFRDYTPQDKPYCLDIFDSNCPVYFAINEREDYSQFLDSNPQGYEVCLLDGEIVGAYGLSGNMPEIQGLNWILIADANQGHGIGHQFMCRVIERANSLNAAQIKIAASHLSAPFFAKYGAIEVLRILDGWGIGMHRVDMELSLK